VLPKFGSVRFWPFFFEPRTELPVRFGNFPEPNRNRMKPITRFGSGLVRFGAVSNHILYRYLIFFRALRKYLSKLIVSYEYFILNCGRSSSGPETAPRTAGSSPYKCLGVTGCKLTSCELTTTLPSQFFLIT
jgi:hypothetical protein